MERLTEGQVDKWRTVRLKDKWTERHISRWVDIGGWKESLTDGPMNKRRNGKMHRQNYRTTDRQMDKCTDGKMNG